MIRYRRKLILWAVGLIPARIFLPFGFVWLALGSLAYFPLNDYYRQLEQRKKIKIQNKRYLHLLEAANVYFQDAYSVGQFLQKLKLQSPPQDPEWSKTIFWMEQTYRSQTDQRIYLDFLLTKLPPEARFFLNALFGHEAFKEQLGEISLTSLRYFRRTLRMDLELEAGIAAQKTEAQVMLVLPFIFRFFLPRLLVTGPSNSPIGLLLASFAWLLALAAGSLFLKSNQASNSFEVVSKHLRAVFLRIPSLKLFQKICSRFIHSKHSMPLLEAWNVSCSTGRTRPDSRTFVPSLEQVLVQNMSRILLLSLGLFVVLLWQNLGGALSLVVLILTSCYLKITTDAKNIGNSIRQDFPEFQHRLYLHLIAGFSLSNAWKELLKDLPPGPLSDDCKNLQFLIQGGNPILEVLTIWSHNIKITEIQESIALLQRYCESGSRESLLRFGEQMIAESSSSQMRQHIRKARLQTGLMIPIMLDLVAIILICLSSALETFGSF